MNRPPATPSTDRELERREKHGTTVPLGQLSKSARRGFLGLIAGTAASHLFAQPINSTARTVQMNDLQSPVTLGSRQLALGPIAANTASGNMPLLNRALDQGLDATLTINEVKEVLVQLYAYAGFPRALNALSEFMKVLDDRRGRDIADSPGRDAGSVPTGLAVLEAGTATQTRLSGAPVKGPLFEFAPAIDQFLKTHLFGDIFGRDNLDWASRELATVAALAAMPGVESQLLSHVRISMNVGITADQLRQYADWLATRSDAGTGRRLLAALDKHLDGTAAK